IIIAKHRNGAVGDVNLRFMKDQARFADMDDSMMPVTPGQSTPAQQYEDFASDSNSGQAGLGTTRESNEFNITPPSLNEEAPF
ncbi:MAG: replicative DNA helicase, partial [Alistipes sp.]